MRCPNKIRKWWSLGTKVRCNGHLEESNDTVFERRYRCGRCKAVFTFPPHRHNCRCSLHPVTGPLEDL